MSKNEMNSKPRRAQGGKGLLSRSILVQKLKIPWFNFYSREERERTERRTEGAPGGDESGVWFLGSRGR